jgi:hypothetical protein
VPGGGVAEKEEFDPIEADGDDCKFDEGQASRWGDPPAAARRPNYGDAWSA